MKKFLNPLSFFLLFIITVQSCNKQDITQAHLNQAKSADVILTLQKSLKDKVNVEQYSNLDWSNVSVNSLDEAHPNSLIRVQDKIDPRKALYYSKIDDKERIYLVTIDLPTKTSSLNEINGSIEIRSIKNVLIKKIIVEKNKAIFIKNFNNLNNDASSTEYLSDHEVSNLKLDPNTCEGCTLPPVVVTTSISGNRYYSLLYTYGAGDIYFSSTPPPSTGGSGGSYSSPYWDKYAPNNNGSGTVITNPFVNKNPAYSDVELPAIVKKYADGHTNWTVVDNKTFTYFNFRFTFQLDKNYKLISNTASAVVTGVSIGNYVMNQVQLPEPIYNNSTMSFMIQGNWVWSSTLNLSMNLPITVNVNNYKTTTPSVNIGYGVAY